MSLGITSEIGFSPHNREEIASGFHHECFALNFKSTQDVSPSVYLQMKLRQKAP
jgi:hypothetical protein